MNKHLFLIIGLAILVLVNFGIYSKEKLLEDGQPLLLKLAPVDPRSLMQGDYMVLNYEISRDWRKLHPDDPAIDGHLVLNLDENNVGSFAELYKDQALKNSQLRLRYRWRNGRLRLATDAYFFEEGSANEYSKASYGEFRVNEEGESLLIALRDEQLQPLGSTLK